MPLKLRVQIAGEAFHNPYQYATPLRACALRWLRGVDADLSATVHDANQPKPYTISPLRPSGVLPGRFHFEISLLTDWLIEPFLDAISHLDSEIRLNDQLYRIVAVETSPLVTWEELMSVPLPKTPEFDLVLHSPTSHHAKGILRKSLVLPDPELYFGSWLDRWNLCCPYALFPAPLPIVEERVAISYCSGGTQVVRLDGKRTFIGFVGKVRFRVLKPGALPQGALQVLSTLVSFANFCGTGVDTMRGMGQTQFLSQQTRRQKDETDKSGK